MQPDRRCDTVKGEQGIAEEEQEHMPTGCAGRETSHNSGPFKENCRSNGMGPFFLWCFSFFSETNTPVATK
jgi:hypothetical protein